MANPTRVTNSIRSLRFAAGEMTQAEIADRVRVTRQTIIAIEQGRYSPSLEMAFRIAKCVRCTAEQRIPLLGGRIMKTKLAREGRKTVDPDYTGLPSLGRQGSGGKEVMTVLVVGGKRRDRPAIGIAAPGTRPQRKGNCEKSAGRRRKRFRSRIDYRRSKEAFSTSAMFNWRNT